MFDKINSVVKAGNMVLGYISGLGILVMSAMLTYEVVLRYFFNSPTIWVQEVSVYVFMWTMLAGASYTLMLGKHVRIDLVFDQFPPKVQMVLDVITNGIGALFSAVVTFQAYEMIVSSLKFNKVSATMLRVPIWILQLSLFLGFLLLTLQFLLMMVQHFQKLKSGCGHKAA